MQEACENLNFPAHKSQPGVEKNQAPSQKSLDLLHWPEWLVSSE